MNRALLALTITFCTTLLSAQNFNLVERSHLTFPGENCANICGYAQNQREYALVGTSAGMRIVDVTNPDVPSMIALIPGVNSDWREIKTWKNFAYVTTEGTGGGLQIVDLSQLPSPTVPFTTYYGDGEIQDKLSRIHALHIDTTLGFAHLFGTRLTDNTAIGDIVVDIKTDPQAPVYVGKWDVNYIHDGYVNNDTLYGGHINAGYFSAIDWHDKQNPVLLATTHTPGNFTHNTWPTAGGTHMLTTDEVDASYLTAYDITDLTNIVEVDRFQTTPGSGSIVHNTHVREGKWAITSWYRDGVSIVDCTRPWNLVEVGRYDMYAGSGGGFQGTWGVYPFLPSGNLVCSGIDEGLFVLTPTWKEACFLEGKCTNSVTASPVGGVQISLSAPNVLVENSKNTGNYATGTADPGSFTATFTKAGYLPQTHPVVLQAGKVTVLDVQLVPLQVTTITGKAVWKGTSTPVEGAKIIFTNASGTFESASDAAGDFTITDIFLGNYEVFGAKWGMRHAHLANVAPVAGLKVEFEKGYQDDFFAELGWTVASTSSTGEFTRAEPVGTNNGGAECNPDLDLPTDLGSDCYTTGNTGGSAASDDVDNGETVLTSPVMNLTGLQNPAISFHYWFYNAGGQGSPNDHLEAWLNNGFTEVQLLLQNQSQSGWRFSDTIAVKQLISPTDMMTLRIRAADDAPGHLVEAAIDGFWVGEKATVGTTGLFEQNNWLAAAPNPFAEAATVSLSLPGASKKAVLRAFDLTGRLVEQRPIDAGAKAISIGKNWEKGIYSIQIEVDGQLSAPVKLVRI